MTGVFSASVRAADVRSGRGDAGQKCLTTALDLRFIV